MDRPDVLVFEGTPAKVTTLVAMAAKKPLREIAAGKVVLQRVDDVLRKRRRVGARSVFDERCQVLSDDLIQHRQRRIYC